MLNPKQHYLQIAFNRTLSQVKQMIDLLPASERILIEAGTPFVKRYGKKGIRALRTWWDYKLQKNGYIVADLKCIDRGSAEVESAAEAGASGATCLGLAPIETINEFIQRCQAVGIDSMVDMLNVEFPIVVLGKLKTLPSIVVLHKGADEAGNREKEIPYYQIQQIKETYDILISVAGGENFRDVGQAFFNDAEIAVVWRSFYEKPQKTTELAREFLKEIR